LDLTLIAELNSAYDRTREVATIFCSNLQFASDTIDDTIDIVGADFFIVTVPTPNRPALQPELTALQQASRTIGSVLKRGDIVV
jgi:UDP-N-acetyl-D-galactosamine dehydrogenase